MVDKPIFEFINRPDHKRGVVGIPINVKSPTLGLYMASGAEYPPGQEMAANQYLHHNYTAPPGAASKLYFSLIFQLPKWGFYMEKPDEWIEVHPTHREYYERTMATKQMLEGIIKSGLKSAAESVADYELIAHDVRKYAEILSYFASKNEHLLRSMFIDQVDVHTGEGISMRSIVPRWPTIISDFMRLSSEDDKDNTPDVIKDRYNVSRAEGVILKTKNDLFKEWRKMFKEAALERYERLKMLMKAREKTIKEYKEWLRPHIGRFKMTRLGAERPGVRSELMGRDEAGLLGVTGLSTYKNVIRLWAWRPVFSSEHRKPAAELKDRGFVVYPYDNWIRENLIINKRTGLSNIYPYLATDKNQCTNNKCRKFFNHELNRCPHCNSVSYVVRKYADELVENQILPLWPKKAKGLDPTQLYYVFQDYEIKRVGFKLPTGELDDVTFYMKNFTVTQNILLVKLLELKCREMELEKYIDQLLGHKTEEDLTISELVKKDFPGLFGKAPKEDTFVEKLKKDWNNLWRPYRKTIKGIRLPKTGLMFVKPGPYERDFSERIKKQYLTESANLHKQVHDWIIGKMGMP